MILAHRVTPPPAKFTHTYRLMVIAWKNWGIFEKGKSVSTKETCPITTFCDKCQLIPHTWGVSYVRQNEREVTLLNCCFFLICVLKNAQLRGNPRSKPHHGETWHVGTSERTFLLINCAAADRNSIPYDRGDTFTFFQNGNVVFLRPEQDNHLFFSHNRLNPPGSAFCVLLRTRTSIVARHVPTVLPYQGAKPVVHGVRDNRTPQQHSLIVKFYPWAESKSLIKKNCSRSKGAVSMHTYSYHWFYFVG